MTSISRWAMTIAAGASLFNAVPAHALDPSAPSQAVLPVGTQIVLNPNKVEMMVLENPEAETSANTVRGSIINPHGAVTFRYTMQETGEDSADIAMDLLNVPSNRHCAINARAVLPYADEYYNEAVSFSARIRCAHIRELTVQQKADLADIVPYHNFSVMQLPVMAQFANLVPAPQAPKTAGQRSAELRAMLRDTLGSDGFDQRRKFMTDVISLGMKATPEISPDLSRVRVVDAQKGLASFHELKGKGTANMRTESRYYNMREQTVCRTSFRLVSRASDADVISGDHNATVSYSMRCQRFSDANNRQQRRDLQEVFSVMSARSTVLAAQQPGVLDPARAAKPSGSMIAYSLQTTIAMSSLHAQIADLGRPLTPRR